jgi:hypothetical protein
MTDLDVWIMAAGAAMIVYGIITSRGHWLVRGLVILFGAVMLFIGMILHSDKEDHHRCR